MGRNEEKKGDCPLFYILIIMALKKVKYGKKGTVPFFLRPKGKKCRHLIEIIQQTKG
jgi:hypothetical protein